MSSKKDPLTESEILDIQVRCQMATPGPWTCPTARDGSKFIVVGIDEELPYTIVAHTRWLNSPFVPDESRAECNAVFIAHAREDIHRLLWEVQRLRRERQALRQLDQGGKFFFDSLDP